MKVTVETDNRKIIEFLSRSGAGVHPERGERVQVEIEVDDEEISRAISFSTEDDACTQSCIVCEDYGWVFAIDPTTNAPDDIVRCAHCLAYDTDDDARQAALTFLQRATFEVDDVEEEDDELDITLDDVDDGDFDSVTPESLFVSSLVSLILYADRMNPGNAPTG